MSVCGKTRHSPVCVRQCRITHNHAHASTPPTREHASWLQIYENAIAELGEDRDLRAVTKIQQFIKLGIGFHHGGLIPLVKELIEILFQVRGVHVQRPHRCGARMPMHPRCLSQAG